MQHKAPVKEKRGKRAEGMDKRNDNHIQEVTS
jgi:hypothetical protein